MRLLTCVGIGGLRFGCFPRGVFFDPAFVPRGIEVLRRVASDHIVLRHGNRRRLFWFPTQPCLPRCLPRHFQLRLLAATSEPGGAANDLRSWRHCKLSTGDSRHNAVQPGGFRRRSNGIGRWRWAQRGQQWLSPYGCHSGRFFACWQSLSTGDSRHNAVQPGGRSRPGVANGSGTRALREASDQSRWSSRRLTFRFVLAAGRNPLAEFLQPSGHRTDDAIDDGFGEPAEQCVFVGGHAFRSVQPVGIMPDIIRSRCRATS